MSEHYHDMKLVFELSSEGRKGCALPEMDVPEANMNELYGAELLREKPAELPEISELDLVRHYTAESQRNYSVDTNFYPLGSCTMKYNPKLNEKTARLDGFVNLHPLQSEESSQGMLQLFYELERMLSEICGMHAFSLQPAAGAQGEFAGMLMARAYHQARKNKKTKVLVPDSAHGTNPASAALCGYEVVSIKSNKKGLVDMDDLRAKATPDVAAFMLTNPNTLGLFEENVQKIAEIIHAQDGLLYYDGANLNALLGVCRPGDMGFDVVHLNLHKTFSTPHGGGGPGAGPVGVKEKLAAFLPVPVIERKDDGTYHLSYKRKQSIGKLTTFYGNTGMLIRAYTYICFHGKEDLKTIAEYAVLNANYLLHRIKERYDFPYGTSCMHEFVASARRQKEQGVRALDIAKKLLDYRFYAPTIYFPNIVEEALMVEPTETESMQTLDAFADALIHIAEDAKENPQNVIKAPERLPVSRCDEVLAARKPILRWKKS